MSPNPVRLRRIARPDGACLMVPLDHGISMGPAPGLADPRTALAAAAQGGATGVTLHKGLGPLPARVAGGQKRDKFAALVAEMQAPRQAGAGGLSVGRNVFQQTDPARALADLVRAFA